MGFIKTINRKIISFQSLFSKDFKIKNKNIIITGANSGIGLALAKILNINNNILAFINQNRSNIENIEGRKVKILNQDFNFIEKNKKNSDIIIEFKPNIIIHSAAIFGSENQKLTELDMKQFYSIFNINVFSALSIIQDSLKGNEVEHVINISSEMGSIDLNKDGDYYYYRSSKSLLNTITKNLSIDLIKKNIRNYCVHPGSVKTKLNSGGLISPKFAAQKIINLCATKTLKFNGKFIDINKKIIQW